MPSSYCEAFDDEAMLAHAGVAARREASATRVEIWRDLPERVVAICIVADDRPGLLSRISAALVAHEIDVVTAHAYCRARSNGAQEAIDLLWIRRVARANGSIGPIRARDVAAIGEMVDALVRGNAELEPTVGFARALRAAPSSTARRSFRRGCSSCRSRSSARSKRARARARARAWPRRWADRAAPEERQHEEEQRQAGDDAFGQADVRARGIDVVGIARA